MSLYQIYDLVIHHFLNRGFRLGIGRPQLPCIEPPLASLYFPFVDVEIRID